MARQFYLKSYVRHPLSEYPTSGHKLGTMIISFYPQEQGAFTSVFESFSACTSRCTIHWHMSLLNVSPTQPNPKGGLHPTLEPMIIEIERNPSPHLLDFHADIGLVDDLRQTLRDSTTSLTIEQLEQLRATCLGNL